MHQSQLHNPFSHSFITCSSQHHNQQTVEYASFKLIIISAPLSSVKIGWIYGSVTEDILTWSKMQCRGWRSIYCMPLRPAFKGSAPINLSDRLHQVLRWALGSVEIFLSRHCPLWYGWGGGRLKLLQRMAYVNTIVYPFMSLPLVAYCTLTAICLLTRKFIIPTVGNSLKLELPINSS